MVERVRRMDEMHGLVTVRPATAVAISPAAGAAVAQPVAADADALVLE